MASIYTYILLLFKCITGSIALSKQLPPVRVSDVIYRKLKEIAESRGVSIYMLVKEIITNYVKETPETKEEIKELKKRISNLESQINLLRKQVDELNNFINSLGSLTEDVLSIEQRLRSIELRVERLQKAIR